MKGLSAPGTVALVTFVGTKREIAPGAGPSPLHSFHCDTGDSFMEENGWLEAKMRPMGDIAAEYGRTRIPRDYNYFVVTAHV